ncbi:hypothetical protein M9H77_35339 [Catharanthus roseus]|uniref:Uncharacterized protein n=1 Tax=Catharanthus roseus TaxID=4058 RepID=A0ACB9ZQG2_CATRO|nr:hypothetical protein M9H77_35339 [Catharanthus roseus]
MFMKLQHFDTSNCFHSLLSTKSNNSINTGTSVTPIKKHNCHKPQSQRLQQQKLRLESSKLGKNGGKMGFDKNPIEKSGKDDNFIDSFVPRDSHGSGVNDLCHRSSSVRIKSKNGSGRVKQEEKFDVNFRGGSAKDAKLKKLHPKDSAKNQNGFIKKPDCIGKNKRENGLELRSGNLNGEVKTKCSRKWLKYGGCLPAILEALESESDLDEAFKPWEHSLSNKERSIILKEQVMWERALEIFEWFKRKGCYEVNVIHYNIMLRILGRARRWDEVERVWEEMVERRIEPVNSTYGTLIDVYSKGGLREHAIKWLELMRSRGMEPDEVTMGIVVQMYKNIGEFKKAEEFFMKWSSGKCVPERPGNVGLGSTRGMNGNTKPLTSLSSYTYNTLIDTYGKAGQVKEASETFDLMLREGIVPNTVTFNTMIHMRGNNGQLDEVSSLIQKMEELRCPPDTRTYNILIFLHAKHDDIDTAAKYFNKMKAAALEPDVVSYRTLLYAFSVRHMVHEAEALIAEMDKRGLEIDEFTQSALIRMYIGAGMLKTSWLWFQRFHLTGTMSSECYSANIDAFGERGYVIEAEKVFNCCREGNQLTVLEFNVMVKAYGISKKYNEACCLFDSMEQHGVFPDRCSYNSLIQMLASADLPEKARNYVRRMQHAGLVDDCIPYCAVISSFAKLGKLEMALELFQEMIGFNIQPDVVVYGVLINAFADTGNVKEAARYVDAMRRSGVQINAVIYNSLIKLYTKVGYLEEAEEAYEMLQSFEVGADVYSSNCMIDLYSKRSMIRQAEKIFENLIRKKQANEFSYAMMLCMYRRNGKFLEAIQIAQKMKELGLLTDLLSFNNVLCLYASDGRYKEAAETFKEMLVSAIQPDDSTFKALGTILLKCGVPREAIGKHELLRKEDAERGLKAWTTTLSSVISISNDVDIDDC